jgi:PAS domain S-box-containing protein
VLRTSDYGVDFYGDILFTSEAVVERAPERVAAFVRASLRGWEYAFAHPEELADRILEMPGVRARGLTRDLLLAEAREMRDLALPDFVTLGHMNPARWRHIAQLLAQQGLASGDADLERFLFDADPPMDRELLGWLAGLVGLSFAGLALTALWSFQMRRTVAQKTLALRAEIRQRETAEAELRTSEERFRQIAENIHEVFWMTEPDKVGLLYVSPAYETIWGQTCASLYEDPAAWLKSVHPEDRERVAEAAQRQADGGYDEVYRIVLSDGSERWIRDRAYPIHDRDGRVYRVVGTAEDITEARRTEKQLLRAQRLESIGTLAGGIAHDLNNLLAPILMSVELLRRESTDVNVHSLADVLEGSARRAAALVRQILGFARGVEGAREAVHVSGLVDELRAMIDSSFPKDIRFESDVPSDAWPVLGDPTQMSQVLLNLALNSRDAMPKGGRLRLRVRNVELDRATPAAPGQPGRYLLLEWSDDGEGIPLAHRDRIFDPFFTTKEVGKGTGLGLAIVLGIVRSHGGNLDVQSEPGRGTTFRIHLPVLEAGVAGASAATTRRGLRGPSAGAGELVLVVDDERAILRLTRRVLEDAGYQVLTAEDGSTAMAAFAEHAAEIALVVTDLVMPKMDGPELIAALRVAAPGLPVIGTSGYFDGTTTPQLLALGVEKVLAKPFSREALLDAIREALESDPSG